MVRAQANKVFDSKAKRLVVTLLLVTGAFGINLFPLDVGFAQLYAFRLVILAVSFVMFVRGALFRNRDELAKGFHLIFWIWFTWGIFGILAFSRDLNTSLNAFSNAVIGLLLIQIFLDLDLANLEGMKTLGYGWCLAFILTGLVSIWSIQNGQHYASEWATYAALGLAQGMTSSTFGNPNNYAGFLDLFLPFLILMIQLSTRVVVKLILLLLFAAAIVLIVSTASRLGILAAVVGIAGYAFMYVMRRAIRVVLFAVVVTLLMFSIMLSVPDFLPLETVNAVFFPRAESYSDEIRLNLVKDGLWFMWISGGLGIGPGNFSYFISHGQGPFTNPGLALITEPHNYLVEIGSQYGLIVLVPFVIWLVMLYRVFLKALKLSSIRPFAVTGIIGLPIYIIAGATSSAFIPGQVNWMFLASYASLSVFVNQALRQARSEIPSDIVVQAELETQTFPHHK